MQCPYITGITQRMEVTEKTQGFILLLKIHSQEAKGEQQFLHVAHYSDLIYMPTQNYKILKVH